MKDLRGYILKKLPLKLLQETAYRHDLDWQLVAAICYHESGCNPYAVRYEPNYRWLYKTNVFARKLGVTELTERKGQKHSYGLMQVMGSVAREAGFHSYFPELFNFDKNLYYGCKHLAGYKSRWLTESDYISAYNQGSPRLGPDGKYWNQSYVSRILELKDIVSND